jgi:hypothetical protein
VVEKGKVVEKVVEGWAMAEEETERVEVVRVVVRGRVVVEVEERVVAKVVREGFYRDSNQVAETLSDSNDVPTTFGKISDSCKQSLQL